MNRRLIFAFLFLLLATVVAISASPASASKPEESAPDTSDSEFFEDDLSNSYYATASTLLKEILLTDDAQELATLRERVIKQYNEIMKIHPNHPIILFNRGAVYASLGKYKKAIEDQNAFLLILPNDVLALENRGRTYELSGDIEHAYKDYKLAQLLLSQNKSLTTNPVILSRFDKSLLRINKKVEGLQDALDQQNKSIPEVQISEVESSSKDEVKSSSEEGVIQGAIRGSHYSYASAQLKGHAWLDAYTGQWYRWQRGFLCGVWYTNVADVENIFWYYVYGHSQVHQQRTASSPHYWVSTGYTIDWTRNHWLFSPPSGSTLNYFSLYPERLVCLGINLPLNSNRIRYIYR